MTDTLYARMMEKMDEVAEAIQEARKEQKPARRLAILNSIVFETERALETRGLDGVARSWFESKWLAAGDEAARLQGELSPHKEMSRT